MAIGVNWKEIWKAVWKPVWTQEAPEPEEPAPAEATDSGPIGGGGSWDTMGGIGTAVRDRKPRHPENVVPEPSYEEQEAEARRRELERERLAAEALLAAEKADRELRESLTPGDPPPAPPAVNLKARIEARGTLKVKAPLLELPLKASLGVRGVVTASISPELPLRALGVARGGAAARMSLEIEDDALALILGVPEMPGDLKEYIRLP